MRQHFAWQRFLFPVPSGVFGPAVREAMFRSRWYGHFLRSQLAPSDVIGTWPLVSALKGITDGLAGSAIIRELTFLTALLCHVKRGKNVQ